MYCRPNLEVQGARDLVLSVALLPVLFSTVVSCFASYTILSPDSLEPLLLVEEGHFNKICNFKCSKLYIK